MRLATHEDISAIQAVYDQAVEREKFVYWNYPMPTDQIAGYIDEGELYCFDDLDGQQVLATAKLTEKADEDLWTKEEIWAGPFLYMAKLAVSNSGAGQRLFRELMLLEIIAEAKEKCVSGLRLECAAGNGRLISLYYSTGFEYLGDVPFSQNGQTSLSKYQKAL